ncbi:hypothetical protein OVA19_00075 [Streptomyces sp. SL203]|nr:hypothetical protein [Streptomyces sp. SL203]MCY1649218.1 hypothetical protein [Streptomyces sp. SL203]
MAESGITPCTWAPLLEPDAETADRLRYAGRSSEELVACGEEWDAVTIAPLSRGLAALDTLGVTPEDRFPVIVDYHRQELIVLVPAGTARDGEEIQGVRALGRGAFLMVPRGEPGTYNAAWLSAPTRLGKRYLGAAALRAAVKTADEARAEGRALC